MGKRRGRRKKSKKPPLPPTSAGFPFVVEWLRRKPGRWVAWHDRRTVQAGSEYVNREEVWFELCEPYRLDSFGERSDLFLEEYDVFFSTNEHGKAAKMILTDPLILPLLMLRASPIPEIPCRVEASIPF